MKTKICTKCGKTKPFEAFRKNRNGCKECEYALHHDYYIKNKERIVKWSCEYNKKYREKNINKIEEYKSQQHIINKYWAQNCLRDHRKHGYTVNITCDKLLKILHKTSYCPLCGASLKCKRGEGYQNNAPSLDRLNNEMTIDESNIWIICHRCNATKSNRTMTEFIAYCKTVIEKFG